MGEIPKGLTASDKSKVFYHINKLTNAHHLCILPFVAPDIPAIAHGKGYLGFSCCYEIITLFWFICGLIKLFHAFICHCSQYLALQTRRYPPYGSVQLIESLSIPFFTLTLDFVLVFLLSEENCNAIISITYKFSKQIPFIEDADTWSAEQWTHAFLNRLDLISYGLSEELIINRDLKFIGKFWTTLFAKLGVKLLHSTVYYLQTDGFSKHTNQTIKIVSQFFVHAMENNSWWPKILPRI